MEEKIKTEQQMIRYLLGEMSIDEQVAMETGYFTDSDKFNLLQVVEADLIEGYVNGKLSASGRAKFERHFLNTPARQEQVRFFQTLTKVVPFDIEQQYQEQASPVRVVSPQSIELGQKAPWWEAILSPFRGPRLALGMSFAAALLILAVGGAWFLVGNRSRDDQRLAVVNPSGSPDPEKVSNPEQGKPQTPQNSIVPSTPKPVAKPVIASFTLTIPGMRDINKNSTTPQIWRIPPDTEFIQLAFNHRGDPYSSYKVSLNYLSGQQVWSRSDVRASRVKSGTLLILNVPAKRFDEGSYSLGISRDNAEGEWVVFHEFLIEVEK